MKPCPEQKCFIFILKLLSQCSDPDVYDDLSFLPSKKVPIGIRIRELFPLNICYRSVLRIWHLVWIRIRGSMPLIRVLLFHEPKN
jgi:hypothetical protein